MKILRAHFEKSSFFAVKFGTYVYQLLQIIFIDIISPLILSLYWQLINYHASVYVVGWKSSMFLVSRGRWLAARSRLLMHLIAKLKHVLKPFVMRVNLITTSFDVLLKTPLSCSIITNSQTERKRFWLLPVIRPRQSFARASTPHCNRSFRRAIAVQNLNLYGSVYRNVFSFFAIKIWMTRNTEFSI